MAFANDSKSIGINDPGFLNFIRGGSQSSSGITINDSTALGDSSFVACISVIAQTLGQLPIEVYRTVNGKDVLVTEGKMVKTLTTKPNQRQTMQEFIELGITHKYINGNYYAHVTKNARDEITQILPFNTAHSVTVNEIGNDINYTVTFPDGTTQTYPKSQILHIRGIAYNTYKGLSVIEIAKESLGLSIAAQEHASTFYKNGSTPGGFLECDKSLSKDAQQRLIQSFEGRHQGSDKAHKLAVLEEGMKYKSVQVSLKEAQLMESRKLSTEEICRIMGVPPQLIGAESKVAFSSVEEINRFFYNSTLGSLVTKYENAINEHMPNGYKVKFDVSKFTKADAGTNAEIVDKMFKASMITINEGRARLGLPSVEGGDVFAIDTNNHTLGSIEDIEKIQEINNEGETNAETESNES